MEFAHLTSKRVELIPPNSKCESAYVRFYTDGEASKLYGGPISASAAAARLRSDTESWTKLGFGVWALKFLDSDQIVGVCGFWQGTGWPIELTWWLLPEARGKGLAQEASKLATRHAYEIWKWNTVETYLKDENALARKLVLALGGQFIERRSFPDSIARDVFRLPRR